MATDGSGLLPCLDDAPCTSPCSTVRRERGIAARRITIYIEVHHRPGNRHSHPQHLHVVRECNRDPRWLRTGPLELVYLRSGSVCKSWLLNGRREPAQVPDKSLCVIGSRGDVAGRVRSPSYCIQRRFVMPV